MENKHIKYYYDVVQNTEEWHKLRIGKLTRKRYGARFVRKKIAGFQ